MNVLINRLGEDNVLVLHDLGYDPPIISEDLAAIVFASPKMAKTHEYMKNGSTTALLRTATTYPYYVRIVRTAGTACDTLISSRRVPCLTSQTSNCCRGTR